VEHSSLYFHRRPHQLGPEHIQPADTTPKCRGTGVLNRNPPIARLFGPGMPVAIFGRSLG
jgi:hypothetical protein